MIFSIIRYNIKETPMFKRTCLLLLVFSIALSCYGCSNLHKNKDVLYQTSTINALLEGVYDGDITFQELKEHGNFGLGTVNHLDGEMLALDGIFYQIKSDGIAYPVDATMKTPFAVVTFFEPDQALSIDTPLDDKELAGYLDSLLPTKNIFYAIKLEGTFSYIKARSVPRQFKPYPPLVEVVKEQKIFEFHNARGTILGFRLPEYMKGINVPGYHLHFITENRKAGGHVLECNIEDVHVEIDYTNNLFMILPETDDFYNLNLTKDKQKQLDKIEK
jgi:acetolactate decarboxylase